MRIEYLSEHVRKMLRETEERKRRASEDTNAARTRVAEAEAELKAARARLPRWRRLIPIASAEEKQARRDLEKARLDLQAARLGERRIGQEIEQQTAGVRGERALADELLATLDDDWIAFAGYCNRRGEADFVVVGPPGIWVVEVKNRTVRLRVDGDDWRWQKLDRMGNSVERGLALDKGNRTWGRQVGDVADALASWLESEGQRVPMRTAVLLMHERASIGRIRDAGVDLVSTGSRSLLQEMTGAADAVDAGARRTIEKLIRRDHGYHNDRPQERS